MQMSAAQTGYFVSPSGYEAVRWSDLFNQVMANIANGTTGSGAGASNTDGGSSQFDNQYIVINGVRTWVQPLWEPDKSNWTLFNIGEAPLVMTMLNIANPDSKPGWNSLLLPGPGDSVRRFDYPQNTSLSELYVMVAIAVTLGAASMAAAGAGTLTSTGAVTATTGETITSEFANEWAKLVQQQMLADSGVDLLSTSLPTLSLSDAAASLSIDPAYANEWAKLVQQQTLADSGVNLLSTSLPTISLSDAGTSLSSLLSPSNIKDAISTIKTAAGALTAAKGIISGSGSSTQLPITTGRQTTFLPAGGAVAPSAGGSSSALLLAAASIIGIAFMRG